MAAQIESGSCTEEFRDALERLVFDCLQRLETEGERALETLCAEHPELARDLRAEIEKLRSIGLIGSAAESSPFPERVGDFRLLTRLGEGGMGVVFEAEQISLRRRVALKLVRPENLLFSGGRERFRREVEAVARLQHPGIVPVHAVGEERGVPFLAMELVRGCTLAEALEELAGGRPEDLSGADLARAVARRARGVQEPVAHGDASAIWVAACLRVALQVAETLAHVHAHGIVHRDVKPSNIALTLDGRAMLLDFGLAAMSGASRLTRSGSQPGSLPYMSPEQLRGERELDGRTDVYSLGATLYEMLALMPAFASESSEELRREILAGEKPPLRVRNRHVPRDVETVCLVAMEPDLERRYRSAADLAADLANLLALRPIAARRIGPVLRARRWCQRHPAPAASGILLVAGAVTLGALELWQDRVERARVSELLGDARELGERGRFDEALERTGAALGVRPADREALELRARWLSAAREKAERSLAEILRLTDSKRLDELLAEEEALWPAVPERVPALEAWLDRAAALFANLEEHQRSLAELRTRALPASDPPAFDEAGDAWHFALLGELVGGLAALARTREAVEARLQRARTIEARSVSSPEALARWAEAIDDIAHSPVYGGLELRPQLGLLPLWRNPRSGLWEFLQVETGAAPALDATSGRCTVGGGTGVVLVLVPAGSFSMGSHAVSPEHPLGSALADPWHRASEEPVRDVALSAFFLSKYELTLGQWLRLGGGHPSAMPSDRDDYVVYPVAYVSWGDCVRVLARVGLVLPTDAQWEYACRAGTTSVYSTGDDPASLRGHANVAEVELGPRQFSPGSSDPREVSPSLRQGDGFAYAAPVGSFAASPWGLHDMHGNLWEWCFDTAGRENEDPVPPRAGDGLQVRPVGRYRISRGGSFHTDGYFARSACRSNNVEDARRTEQGVRPARKLD